MPLKGEKKDSPTPLNDENWSAFLFVVYLDVGLPEITAVKIAQFGEWISSGHRQRFSTVTKQEVTGWALENAKLNEVCKDVKAALDSGIAEVPDSLMAKVLRAYLFSIKDEAVELKTGKVKESTVQETVDEGKGKKKDAGASKKPQAAPAKATGKQPEIVPVASPGNDLKKKSKLRERTGGGPQKDRIATSSIGDEPADGPDCYFYLKDFDSPSFLAAFSEEADIGIDAVFRGLYDPTDVVGKKGENNKTEEQMTNPSWLAVKSRAKQSTLDNWRKTAWETAKTSDFKDAKMAFEIVSNKIYYILEKRKMYTSFYKNDKVLSIGAVDLETVDLRAYEHIVTLANLKGVANIESTLGLLLEYFDRSTSSDSPPGTENLEIILASVRNILETEFNRLSLDTSFKAYSPEPEKNASLVPLESCDINGLQSLLMNANQNLGVKPGKLIEEVQNNYRSNLFVYFLEKIPSFKTYHPTRIAAESMKLKTEFWKNTAVRDLEFEQIEKFVYQSDFEKICKPLVDELCCKDFNLREWRWYGPLSPSSILQAIENAKVMRPEAHYQLSDMTGKLLLVLKSPGPIGCTEYLKTKKIYIRSKVGFSVFNELYDMVENTLGSEKPSISGSQPAIAYDMKDRIISFDKEDSYLYAANDIVITVSRAIWPTVKDIRTNITFADNSISFSGTNQSKSKSEYFTARFFDGCVFSMTNKNASPIIQFSDKQENHITFGKDGSITIQSFRKNFIISSMKTREAKRVFLPTGVVIKHFDSKAIQVLFPDGSLANKAPGAKEWVKVARDEEEKFGVESKLTNDDIEISREDFVTISKIGNRISTEHACGTIITTIIGESCSITCPNFPEVIFHSNGLRSVTVSKNFSVERLFLNGGTSSAIKIKRSDMNIDIESNGDVRIKLSDYGYKNPIVDRNTVNLNWIAGTMTLRDVCNWQFSISEDGKTKIIKPVETLPFPELCFGGNSLKQALNASKKSPTMTGNTPVLFILSPDGLDSYRVHRDLDQLAYFQSNHEHFDKILEEPGTVANSISCCTTKKCEIEGMEQQVVLYSQFIRYRQIKVDQKAILTKEYESFLQRVKEREETKPTSELGETADTATSDDPFVIGAKKKSTQLAIALKFMEKEGYYQDQGVFINSSMAQLAGVKKVKLNLNAAEFAPIAVAEKPKTAATRKKGPYHIPPFFDSPEGRLYLSTLKVDMGQSTMRLNEVDSLQDIYEDPGRVRTREGSLMPKNQDQTNLVVEQRDELNRNPGSQLAEAEQNDVEIESYYQEPAVEVLAVPVKPVKKVRHLNLPAAIMGAKPGAIPNTAHINREAGVRRKLHTGSTSTNQKSNPYYGAPEFVVVPSKCDFGVLHIDELGTKEMVVEMTNIGLDSGRFKIKQAENSAFQVTYKHRAVAPGMGVKLKIKPRPNLTCQMVKEELVIISEMEILHIPLKLDITALTAIKVAPTDENKAE